MTVINIRFYRWSFHFALLSIFLCLGLTILSAVNSEARILNVPGTYHEIQTAIDHSHNGDTVLVAVGTYVENIDFSGLNIVVASHFILSGDTTYIGNTIIDGDSLGPVVIMENEEDSSAVLEGFTIRNGFGSNGGGISCFFASPTIARNIVCDNVALNGAGIYLAFSNSIVKNNMISDNLAMREGGGVRLYFSECNLEGNAVCGNSAQNGGGIACNNSILHSTQNLIIDNRSLDFEPAGAGLELRYGSRCWLTNSTLSTNEAVKGYGIYCDTSSFLDCKNALIWGNLPDEFIANIDEVAVFEYSDLCGSISGTNNLTEDPQFINLASNGGNYYSNSPCINAGDPEIVDPDGSRSDIGYFYGTHPSPGMNRRWYISPNGIDSVGRGEYGLPLRTIGYGINASSSGDTLIALNGDYEESIKLTTKNLTICSNYLLSRDTLDIINTIIDGDSLFPGPIIACTDNRTVLVGFTITDCEDYGIMAVNADFRLEHNIFRGMHLGAAIYCKKSNFEITYNDISSMDNSTASGGIICSDCTGSIKWNLIHDNGFGYGALNCTRSALEISDNRVFNNNPALYCINGNYNIIRNVINGNSRAYRGGGIDLRNSSARIGNNIIFDNLAGGGNGGGISILNSDSVLIVNNVISRNESNYGGGISLINSSPQLINNIIWGNASFYDTTSLYYDENSVPEISYCDIEGFSIFDGNFSLDPQFKAPENDDFHLKSVFCGDLVDSPCIDRGNPEILDAYLTCEWGLGEVRSDIGAFGGGDSTSIGINESNNIIPNFIRLFDNYPNPFNSRTLIKYELGKSSDIRLIIYDILGRKLETLLDEYQSAGLHSVNWNGDGRPSGVYFYRVETGGHSQSKRMLLVK